MHAPQAFTRETNSFNTLSITITAPPELEDEAYWLVVTIAGAGSSTTWDASIDAAHLWEQLKLDESSFPTNIDTYELNEEQNDWVHNGIEVTKGPIQLFLGDQEIHGANFTTAQELVAAAQHHVSEPIDCDKSDDQSNSRGVAAHLCGAAVIAVLALTAYTCWPRSTGAKTTVAG